MILPVSHKVDGFVILTPNIVYSRAKKIQKLIVYDTTNGTTTLPLPSYRWDSRVVTEREPVESWVQRLGRANSEDEEHCLVPFGKQEVFGLAGKGGAELWLFNPNFAPDLPDAPPLATEGHTRK